MVLFKIFVHRISMRCQVMEVVKLGCLLIPHLLFADYMVVLTSFNSDLQSTLEWFAVIVCGKFRQ